VLTDYIDAAMRHATYKRLATGEYFGEIPGLRGLWAVGPTADACREELRDVLEGWLEVKLRRGHPLPDFDGVSLRPEPVS